LLSVEYWGLLSGSRWGLSWGSQSVYRWGLQMNLLQWEIKTWEVHWGVMSGSRWGMQSELHSAQHSVIKTGSLWALN
jgi:hypothetical protein